MEYDFNSIINRTNTNSIKYDFAQERGMPEGTLPMWVADMDFQTAPEIVEALVKTARHGIFGYSDSKSDYSEAVQNWFESRFQWSFEKEWLVKVPGVVFAVAAAIRALTEPGDAVIIQKPVYYPFFEVILSNGRKLVNNALVLENSVYHIDFEDFEAKIQHNDVKMFILCSPHNPVGRVWTRDELKRLGDICLKHNVMIVSDEIHADFVYPGNTHTIFAQLGAEYRNIAIICTSPSKSFNLAGLQVSNIFIANRETRKSFRQEVSRTGYSQLNTMGLASCISAYRYGLQWLDDLRGYLAGNLDFAKTFLSQRLPQ